MTEAIDEQRKKYLLEMRKRFCPSEMLEGDTGMLREEYFRPPKPKKIISEAEEELIVKSLETHGFGAWEEIAKEHFPDVDRNELRIKCMELVGKQDLSEYMGRKMTKEELDAEREKNLIEGKEKKLLVWGKVMADEKHGVLI